jgi:hypothetical protein
MRMSRTDLVRLYVVQRALRHYACTPPAAAV